MVVVNFNDRIKALEGEFVQITAVTGFAISGCRLAAVGEDYLRLSYGAGGYSYVNLAHVVLIKPVGKPTHWKESE